MKCDQRNASELRHVFEETRERYGEVDQVFINGGLFGGPGSLFDDGDETDATLKRLIDTNVLGPTLALRYAVPTVRPGGTIIMTASTSATLANDKGMPDGHMALPYAATRSYVDALGRLVGRQAIRERNIRFFTLNPGVTQTEIFPDRTQGDAVAQMINAILPGRTTYLDEFVAVYESLATGRSAWHNGASIITDGLFTADAQWRYSQLDKRGDTAAASPPIPVHLVRDVDGKPCSFSETKRKQIMDEYKQKRDEL